MNSTKDLLHQIHDPNLSVEQRALARCRLAKHYEEIGNYEAAREAMGALWAGVGTSPNVEGLFHRTAGEVLLRAGSLTGWIGSTKQIEGAQETAKDLISKSIAFFESLKDTKKVAEAQTEIALCYRRQGALDEARVMFAQALNRLDDQDGDLKAVALLRSAVVEQLANQWKEALNILKTAAPLFEHSTNFTLKGRFHNEYALVLRNLGAIENCADYVDQALIEYEAASEYFGKAKHARYQACVENNLAFLFLRVNRLAQAHEHLVRAEALFTDLRDNVHLAQVEETWARIFLAEGHLKKAERFANSAVKRLETGGEQSLLAEALIILGIVLSRLNGEGRARDVFQRAITIGEQAGDLEKAGLAALTLFEQLFKQLSDDDIFDVLERAHDLLRRSKNADTRNRLLESIYHSLSLIHIFRPGWDGFSLEERLQRHEARYIRMALEDAGGVISKAARLLGVSQQALDYRLKNPHKYLCNLLSAIVTEGHEANIDENTTVDLDNAAIEKSRQMSAGRNLVDKAKSRAALEQIIAVAEQTGDLESAGLAALTLFEQLGDQLSDDEICEIVERAREFLRHSTNAETRDRLLECSYRALSLIRIFRPNWDGFSLYQTLHRHQAGYISMALEDADGVISQAARLLGLPRHTNLHYMLKNPYKNVLAASQPAQTVSILHVEDNQMVAEAVKETLETQGWQVETCADGNAALEKISSEAHYDLLLIDYDLPGMNGLELVRRARKLAHRSRTPIVMLSASPVEAAAREAGASVFLQKPRDVVSSLVETITRLLEEREQEG